jgi:hypothetical protein
VHTALYISAYILAFLDDHDWYSYYTCLVQKWGLGVWNQCFLSPRWIASQGLWAPSTQSNLVLRCQTLASSYFTIIAWFCVTRSGTFPLLNWIEFINWHSLKWAFQWQFTWIFRINYELSTIYIFTTILSKLLRELKLYYILWFMS